MGAKRRVANVCYCATNDATLTIRPNPIAASSLDLVDVETSLDKYTFYNIIPLFLAEDDTLPQSLCRH